MERFRHYGNSSPEESQRERDHRRLARRAAAESMVLLKNNDVLPLTPGPIALYGPGGRRTVKGGAGSGEVRERYSVSMEEGLKNAGFTFPTTLWQDRFEETNRINLAAWRQEVCEAIRGYSPLRTMEMFIRIGEHPRPKQVCTPILPDELTDQTDTAVYVLSRQAGEGFDRRVEQGDYLLSDTEEESLRLLSARYKKLILILNCGGVLDLSILDEIRIDAVLFAGQPGTEGGNAAADVLTGKVNPCGRLTDTWARRYEDYPAADTFGHRNGDLKNEEYTEDVYVGYRWFEKRSIVPRFPFGFGLSYTTFSVRAAPLPPDGTTVSLKAEVTNTGSCSGKEIVELYLKKPGGVPELAAFFKTDCLAPGGSQREVLSFDLCGLADFDEQEHAFVLPAGTWEVLLNGDVVMTIDRQTRTVTERVCPIGENAPVTPACTPSPKAAAILGKLNKREKCMLVTGGGYPIRAYNNVMGAAGRTCTKLLKKGIPNIVLADGPAGINVLPVTAVGPEGFPRYPDGLPEDWRWGWLTRTEPLLRAIPGGGRKLYRYMTAWPCAALLAQSRDTALLREIGRAVGREMLEIGVSVWLAPAMNIHRSPLCGRNFEYYSEDPLLAGKMAAAVTQGVQSMGGVGVSVKHFCCNNQEDGRTEVSANLSEKALREIYLRAFRIAVTEGKPYTVMSSYNRVNGTYVCNSPDLLTRVLRREWGFEGLVMSDWNAADKCSCAEAINAGNDLIMPGTPAVTELLMKDLALREDALNASAGRVLDLIFKCDTAKGF